MGEDWHFSSLLNWNSCESFSKEILLWIGWETGTQLCRIFLPFYQMDRDPETMMAELSR
jgi:hypothetical protein